MTVLKYSIKNPYYIDDIKKKKFQNSRLSRTEKSAVKIASIKMFEASVRSDRIDSRFNSNRDCRSSIINFMLSDSITESMFLITSTTINYCLLYRYETR